VNLNETVEQSGCCESLERKRSTAPLMKAVHGQGRNIGYAEWLPVFLQQTIDLPVCHTLNQTIIRACQTKGGGVPCFNGQAKEKIYSNFYIRGSPKGISYASGFPLR